MTAPPAEYEALTVAELARLHEADRRLHEIRELVAAWRALLRPPGQDYVVSVDTMFDVAAVIER